MQGCADSLQVLSAERKAGSGFSMCTEHAVMTEGFHERMNELCGTDRSGHCDAQPASPAVNHLHCWPLLQLVDPLQESAQEAHSCLAQGHAGPWAVLT